MEANFYQEMLVVRILLLMQNACFIIKQILLQDAASIPVHRPLIAIAEWKMLCGWSGVVVLYQAL